MDKFNLLFKIFVMISSSFFAGISYAEHNKINCIIWFIFASVAGLLTSLDYFTKGD